MDRGIGMDRGMDRSGGWTNTMGLRADHTNETLSPGFNTGFLSITVATHNGCGIAAGGELFFDYGDLFDLAVPLRSPLCRIPGNQPLVRKAKASLRTATPPHQFREDLCNHAAAKYLQGPWFPGCLGSR